MEIEKIIYNTTREIYSVEDKLSIGTIFIFCYKFSGFKFAELLYTDDHKGLINNLSEEFLDYEVDFTVRLEDKNINSCFHKTLEKVREKYDSNGYYKALFEGDEYALAVNELTNYKFSSIEIKKNLKNYQTSLF